MTDKLIEPRTLRGFRDFLPEMMMPREAIIDTAKRVYRSYGFAPIDTPALEYYEILAGKGSDETDRQMYQFKDHGDRHVGMRFDLTVPLARFVAQHSAALGMPFKRYHIATVWRGENNQAGRYREFMQCDFDTIGKTSIASDIETALVIFDLLRAIGFQRFQIRLNNRKILNGLLDKFSLREHSVAVLRALDKLAKVGRDSVRNEIQTATGAANSAIDQVLQLTELTSRHQPGDNQRILAQLGPLCLGNPMAETGFEELRQIISATDAVGISDEHLGIDVSIARGLDYYTGSIYETFLSDLPGIGSVCSGGRYDNLAGLYTREELPGIGASLGLDRLLAAMEQLKLLPTSKTPADVLIVLFDLKLLPEYLKIAKDLRLAGLGVEVFPATAKLGQQFKYADRRGFTAALVMGENEMQQQQIQVKWLGSGEQVLAPLDPNHTALIAALRNRIPRSN